MSNQRLSIIPARAATDRQLKPRDLQVLCVLGRHTDDFGWCRRSQVRMAAEMDCARATVYEAIERLVKAGYLERHVQETENGRDSAHVYRVILDPVHPNRDAIAAADEPAEMSDSVSDLGRAASTPPAGISAPPAGPGAAPPAGSGPAPINDPSLTTLAEPEERERAGEIENQDRDQVQADRRNEGRAFEKAFRAWPTSLADSRASAWRSWQRLSVDARQTAADEIGRYVEAVKAAGRTKFCAFAVYLDERRWEGLAARPAPKPQAGDPDTVHAPAFGPGWAAVRQRELFSAMADIAEDPETPDKARTAFETMTGMLGREKAQAHFGARGFGFDADGGLVFPDDFALRAWRRLTALRGWPVVNRMHAGAASGRGVLMHRRLEGLAAMMEPVPVGSTVFEAWRLEHERRGWPWIPDPGGMRVVYFPAGGPEGLAEFEAKVRETSAPVDGQRSEAAE